jgi:protein involved in sex pheromone biosynthesis
MATATEAMERIRDNIEEFFPQWADIFARATHRG